MIEIRTLFDESARAAGFRPLDPAVRHTVYEQRVVRTAISGTIEAIRRACPEFAPERIHRASLLCPRVASYIVTALNAGLRLGEGQGLPNAPRESLALRIGSLLSDDGSRGVELGLRRKAWGRPDTPILDVRLLSGGSPRAILEVHEGLTVAPGVVDCTAVPGMLDAIRNDITLIPQLAPTTAR
jgi:hypothetical protein